ncbi:GNAT family N-acetyltransferase [Sphingomonas sp. GM_Shp_1]|uniref:GNAT family N-acetyltransferase n=1 Tax=Sphingomonas sp. GM_Shp_1 TaxID=2937381 RepID=UPI00226BB628|nr:GNAT family N-acetyltransferase [Sphingomonas sp. GM_Shp_1]
MTDAPQPVLAYWRKAFAGCQPDDPAEVSYAISDTLNPKRPVMILEKVDGSVCAAIRPEVADRAGVGFADRLSIEGFKARLEGAGIILHDPDCLFYRGNGAAFLPRADKAIPVRRIAEDDRRVFEAFLAEASEQDKEDAWVELDHWAVFGCFDGMRLVSAASAYLWTDSPMADLGVLTLPEARGRGYARAVVQAISGFARSHGYEPQYRCQLDNHPSIGLAKACDLTMFGTWTVAVDQNGP